MTTKLEHTRRDWPCIGQYVNGNPARPAGDAIRILSGLPLQGYPERRTGQLIVRGAQLRPRPMMKGPR